MAGGAPGNGDWDGNDRRSAKRFGVKDAAVQYTRGGVLSFLNSPSRRYFLLNLSAGGCYFISQEELREGETLKMVIEAPHASSPIHASGKVAWVRKSREFEAWRVGIEFSKMSDSARKALKFVLDNTILKKVDVSTRAYLRDIEKL